MKNNNKIYPKEELMKFLTEIKSVETPAKNQIFLNGNAWSVFISYGKAVAIEYIGNIYLDEVYWKYSITTIRWRNKFLHKTSQEVKKSIENKTIIFVNMN